MSTKERLVVFVPAQTALVYDQAGWHLQWAPPQWWLDEQAELLELDVDRWRQPPPRHLTVVPPHPRRTTPCRPGRGPCRRRHEHASPRRDERAQQAS